MLLIPSGHNTNGQYFVSSNKTSFDSVLTPRRIGGYMEKTRDGIKFLDNIVIKDVACGANHTVRPKASQVQSPHRSEGQKPAPTFSLSTLCFKSVNAYTYS